MAITSSLIIDTEDLSDETVQEIHEAVTAILAKSSDFTPDADAVEGWTPATAAELDKRLRKRNRPVQADTIAAAAHTAGYVERATVYSLGGYEDSRSLSGFTKPVKGVMKAMIAEGLIPADAANPMESEYDPTNPAYQRALGFRMPVAVAKVFAEVLPDPTAS